MWQDSHPMVVSGNKNPPPVLKGDFWKSMQSETI